jgi:antirestriction protein ArdC
MNKNLSKYNSKIISALKKGIIPWRLNFHQDPQVYGPATSCYTRNPYRNITKLYLGLLTLCNDYQSKWWGTKKYWERLKARTIPGFGMKVPFFYKDKQTKNVVSKIGLSVLYNLDTVEGESVDYLRNSSPDKINDGNYEEIDKLVIDSGARINYNSKKPFAFYEYPEPYQTFPKHTSGDIIDIPRKIDFLNEKQYYHTLIHELCHWAEVRTGWRRDKVEFYNYEMGELIAEIASAWILQELHLPLGPQLDNHNKYLPNWLLAMNNDKKFIFKAVFRADIIKNYILSFKPKKMFDY